MFECWCLSIGVQFIISLTHSLLVQVPENDEFFVIACDGIWEVMSSQEVVTFVSKKLKEGKMSLGEIAGALCDECLSSDPDQTDCYGCDNMSVVIVKLDNLPTLAVGEPSTPTRKRRKIVMSSPRILRPRLVSPKDESRHVAADKKSDAKEQ